MPSELSTSEHRTKEQILTQHEPSMIRRSTDAVILKQGELFLLTDECGDVPWGLPHGLGLFFRDCRYLDGYTLTVNGNVLTALSAEDSKGYKTSHTSRIRRYQQ